MRLLNQLLYQSTDAIEAFLSPAADAITAKVAPVQAVAAALIAGHRLEQRHKYGSKKKGGVGDAASADDEDQEELMNLSELALRCFAGSFARHEPAAQMMLDHALGIALPVRLVVLLQSCVRSIESRPEPSSSDEEDDLYPMPMPGPTYLEERLVGDALLLLLEFAREIDMRRELEGGCWISDTFYVTRYVTSKVNPRLETHALAAKLLQNGLRAPKE